MMSLALGNSDTLSDSDELWPVSRAQCQSQASTDRQLRARQADRSTGQNRRARLAACVPGSASTVRPGGLIAANFVRSIDNPLPMCPGTTASDRGVNHSEGLLDIDDVLPVTRHYQV